MLRIACIPTAPLPGRSRGLRILSASLVALGAALAAPPSVADQAYPPGLFENSPVVPPGQPAGEPAPGAPPDADGPTADSGPPGDSPPIGADRYDAPPGPYGPGPPPGPDIPAAPYRGEADVPPYDYCAGIATRTFRSIEEVRRAHARCDRAYYAPSPNYPPRY